MRNWILAARPKTLTAALVPVMVGTALAKPDIHWELSFFALIVAILIQVGTNFINDAIDFKKGADTHERQGPVRVTQAGLISAEKVMGAGFGVLTLAVLFGTPLVMAGGWPIGVLLLGSVVLAYCYTGGPYPLAYHGLGDLFVFLFFGVVSTCSLFYIQTGELTLKALIAGVQVGLLATVLIAINNLRDTKTDIKANKKTLPVRFGETFGKWEITLLIFGVYLLNAYWLPLLTLPISFFILRGVWVGQNYNQLLAISALNQLLFGALLSISL